MNVLQSVEEKLCDRHLTDFEKVICIYNMCNKIFHFDSRWFYTEVWNDDGLSKKIKYRKIDLEDVQDFGVICRSYSTQVLKPLIDTFTTNGCKAIIGDYHTFITYEDSEGITWELDAAHGDLARGKIDLRPSGFTTNYTGFDNELDDIYSNLGFSFRTKSEYKDMLEYTDIVEMYRQIGYLLDATEAKYHYTDANFFLNMMACTLKRYNVTYLDRDYHFHSLIEVNDGIAYFDMSKEDEHYSLQQIDEDKYNYCTKTLRKKH